MSLNISAPQLDSRWLASVTEESIRNSPIPGVRVKYGVYDKIPPQRDLAHIYRSIAGKLRKIRDSFDEDLVVFGAEEERLILRRHQLASDMESSLANGDFHVVYQPKHYASSGKLCGAEALVRHCIELAHDLGLCVVAEGVETQEQLDKLRALGCDKVQGYYFSRPLPADEFIAYLKDHAARGMIA